ncbi:MAG TPA: IPT/TIG domain-containing protein [Candidatus Acidoferrum sp.]|nr:IPT/TIG domain-containing protein [Candidatus Acidoferrum sp.]
MAGKSLSVGPAWVLVCLAAAAGCGGAGGARDIVQRDELSSSAAGPKITRVTDLGDMRTPLPRRGVMPRPDSDDRFALGELILIEGNDFGRLPAVRIGGQAVRILARTGTGGIVCRIPAGIDSGTIEIVISHEGGRDATSIGVERYAVLVDRTTGQVHFVALGRGSEGDVRATLAIPGALDARISPDGRAAYVVANPGPADETATLHVISLTAAGGPKPVRTLHLDLAHVVAFGVATRAPLGAVAGRGRLVLLDLKSALRPRALAPFPLVAEPGSLAVEPDGARIGLLSPRDNILTPIDVRQRDLPHVEQSVDLLPGEREPMAVDLEFSPGGGELWVLLGDGPRARSDDEIHPTRLVSVSWETGTPRIESTAEVKKATGVPVALAVGRRARSASRPAPILIATVSRKLYATGPGIAPSRLGDLGQIVAADMSGHSRVLSSHTAVYGDPEVSHDLAWVVSPTVRLLRGAGGTRFELGLSFDPLPDTRGKYRFVKLGEGRPAGLKRPPVFAIAP